MKKYKGNILGVIVFLIIVVIGITFGMKLAKKNNLEIVNILNKINISIFNDEEVKYTDLSKILKIDEICGSDTGICDKDLSYLKVDNDKYKLKVYVNFDNLESSNYIIFNNKKIDNLSNIDNLYLLGDKYLLFTNSDADSDTYKIYVYDVNGNLVKDIDAYYDEKSISLVDNIVYYNYCEKNEEKNILYTYGISSNNEVSTYEINKEENKC